jgi:putative transposase
MKTYQSQLPVRQLCSWLKVPHSVYYYSPKEGKPGAKPSTHTRMKDGTSVPNSRVVEAIKTELNQEFVCYGYQNMTAILRDQNFIINHKKVYRLMDESHLLLGKVIRTSGKREFVKFRKIKADYPMQYLCLDIKYFPVAGEQRYYYLLSVMDVYSRKIIEWILQSSIRKADVVNLFRRINNKYGIRDVIIRNDNGSQFLANHVKAYLKSVEAKQEFTHIATPEENSYIEAFHSILERELVQRFEFESFYQAKLTMERYMFFYNCQRRHGRLGRITPQRKWEQGVAARAAVKPQDLALAGLSRSADSSKKSNELSAVHFNLEKPKALEYLCLTDDLASVENDTSENENLSKL